MTIKEKLSFLLQNIENEVVEFKEAKSNYDFDKLGKYFSALSNEANIKHKSVAWLVFGVNDQRQIVGTKYRDRENSLDHLYQELASQTTARHTFKQIHDIYISEKRVVLFEIPPAPIATPISFKGYYYGREGSSINALSIAEMDYIRSQTKLDWAKKTVPEATIDDLDKQALNFAQKQFFKKHPNLREDGQTWNTTTFLNKSKLAIKGQITYGALLLVGKDESSHYLSPIDPTISWILKDSNNIEQDYEHFRPPFLLAIDKVFRKIRNLKYRYIPHGTLFPDEVDRYDPYIIREALNNCIAHQDYGIGARITVVETDNHSLLFKNKGSFIPKSIENVITSDAPESYYQNPYLVELMKNFGMIDTVGSGIKKMFNIQRQKFFPLPDYSFSNQSVSVTITGHMLDLDYAIKLASQPDLTLNDIFLLDKIYKKQAVDLNKTQIKYLRNKGWIEGRMPNLYISENLSKATETTIDYHKRRAIDDDFCKEMIVRFLQTEPAKRSQIEELLIDKLPDSLSTSQKTNKIRNILQSLRREGTLKVIKDRKWSINTD